LTLDDLLADLDRAIVHTWGGEEPVAPADAGQRCLLVTCAGRRFALPAGGVTAAGELPPVSALPFAPDWLRGVARASGGVVAVVDLARLLYAEPPPGPVAGAADPTDASSRETLLVVQTADAHLDAGLAVRGIARLVTLAGAPGRAPVAGELGACREDLVAGLVSDPTDADRPPVAVLDLDRLLRAAREDLGG